MQVLNAVVMRHGHNITLSLINRLRPCQVDAEWPDIEMAAVVALDLPEQRHRLDVRAIVGPWADDQLVILLSPPDSHVG